MSSKIKKNQKHKEASIRIIGGDWRGRKLKVPIADGLRPTGDRLRETLFNWLAPIIPGAHCLDAFAGTGVLGLEALSRGAKSVQFLELNRATCAQLRNNLAILACDDAQVSHSDALVWLSQAPTCSYDIVFIDPPFAQDLWATAMDSLAPWLSSHSFIYIEAPKNSVLNVPTSWELHRQKTMAHVSALLYKTKAAEAR